VLEEALINFSGTSVVVSHDRWFLDRICDRVIVFEGGGQVAIQEGNYSYYLEKRRSLDAIASASRVKPAKKKRVRIDEGKPRKLKWKEESELEGMEDNILAAESEIEEIEAQLNDPSFYIENSEKAVEMSKDLEQKKEAIRLLYERWEELEAIRLAWESEKGS
jgi:ATP-binding cassette subfamily F protein uup